MSSNTDTKKMYEMIKFYKDFTIEYYKHNKDQFYINTGLPVLIGFVGYIYQVPIIVNALRFALVLNVIASGLLCSAIIVGTCIYDTNSKVEDDYETEEDENYEDKYNIDEIEDVSGNPSETVYISDTTPDGIVFMRYNNYKEGFEYWADKSIKYDYLETICRKYVKHFRCKNMYIDRKRLLKEKKERAEEEKKRQEEQEKMEKEDMEKLDDVDDDDDVFAKLKTNVDKRYEGKRKNDNENVVDSANKYIYMGKLNEMMPFNVKRTDELSTEVNKKEMSFSMFKRLGF